MLYKEGRGVAQNGVLAYMLFCLATNANYELAPANKIETAKQLLPTQIAEATELATHWQKGQPLPVGNSKQ